MKTFLMPSSMYIQYIMVPIKHILCPALPMDISSTKGMCMQKCRRECLPNISNNIC